MSRETKFRIRQNGRIIGYEWLEDGQWFSYSTDIDVDKDGVLLRQRPGTFFPTEAAVSREQYIGIKDNAGQEIYKNDIVRLGEYIHKVEWDELACGFYIGGCPTVGVLDGNCEIIGDIYNNPELIKALS